jgi:hypothetical protein
VTSVNASPTRNFLERKSMRSLRNAIAALVFVAVSTAAHAAGPIMLTVNDAGDAGPGNCSSVCTLRDAISNVASGGYIDFAEELLPATITLTKGPLLIVKPLSILGPGADQLAISANLASRVLNLDTTIDTVRISGATLRDGTVTGVAGSNGGKETGNGGGSGEFAYGGCIFARDSSLHLEKTDIRNCVARGGNGGHGGSGVPHTSVGGPGGAGGPGGPARGGAIYFLTYPATGFQLVLHDSSVTDSQAIGGVGGAGGAGGDGTFFGSGGSGGEGGRASAGAIEWYIGSDIPPGSVVVANSTLADSAAIGGNGGNGGTHGGDGGSGGPAFGGLVALDRISASIDFGTLANGNALGGAGGSGSTPGGAGSIFGAAIYQDKNSPGVGIVAQSTVIVGPGPLCWSTMYHSGHNLDQDGSCGFDLQGSLALFRPADPGAERPHYMPVYRSAVIDAAGSCFDHNVLMVDADQLGTPRPQGSTCDLGAIEADYVFVDGLE